MDPKELLNLLLLAADAKTDEQKARVAWRASDAMWRDIGTWGIAFPRAFNNIVQDQRYPWVRNLWSQEELDQHRLELDAVIIRGKAP